uniref:Septin-type G domain-containing protein n=1 Tax=Panagrellus redivivus TaxID=6233 RepID=A0A7E4V6W6_PANRE
MVKNDQERAENGEDQNTVEKPTRTKNLQQSHQNSSGRSITMSFFSPLSERNRSGSINSTASKASSRFEQLFGLRSKNSKKRSNSTTSGGKENDTNSLYRPASVSDNLKSGTYRKPAPFHSSDPRSQFFKPGGATFVREETITPADFSDRMIDLKKPFTAPPPVPGYASLSHRPYQSGASRSSTMSTDGTISSGMSKDVPSSSASVIDSKHHRNHDDHLRGKENLKPPTMPKTIVTEDGTTMPLVHLNGYVGFESLPCQLVHYCKKQGFQFNLLCVGTTGSGKTTLMESLFNMKLELEPCDTELKSVELKSQVFEVEEGGVKVKLRFVETAGFGGQASVEQSAKTIVDYLDEQYEAYLREELKVSRRLSQYNDTRIHACLYLISATGHGLLTRDLHTLRELSKRVNVIPIIARADTRCKDELVRFKKRVLEELRQNNIDYYTFPTDDEAIKKQNEVLNKLMPFAVVGSTDFVTKEDGSTVRARSYPWGIVEVENEEHCDFVRLREALLRLNVDSLRTRTHKILYEAYRQDRLLKMNMKDGDCGPKMAEAYEQMNSEFKAEMVKKDREFDRIFTERVNQKEADLKRQEELLDLRQRAMEERHEDEMRRVEASIKLAEDELVKLKARDAKKKQKS